MPDRERWPLERRLIFDDITAERDRQETLLASGKFAWTCAGPDVPDLDRLAVLAEEFGEVAREVCRVACEKGTPSGDLRVELVHVAAVAVAWLEGIDA